MTLKPQDIYLLLKIIAYRDSSWTYGKLAADVSMSSSEVHAGLKRARIAGLALDGEPGAPVLPLHRPLEELVFHGIRYVFVPERGEPTRGMPTAWAAPVLSDVFVYVPGELPPVWPHPQGTETGIPVSPLYSTVAGAAEQDPLLYDLLALVDVFRLGRIREKQTAQNRFHTLLIGERQ